MARGLRLLVGGPDEQSSGVLGQAVYGLGPAPTDPFMLRVPMPVLPEGGEVLTRWLVNGDVREGQLGGLHYRCNDELLFGSIRLREADYCTNDQASALQQASEAAYRELFCALAATDFPHLVRCWNYLPGINRDGGGLERYRQFNIGRQDAFIAASHAYLDGAPAACALGTDEGDLLLYFLAARCAPQTIENPRQLSAYFYPREYGPRSPTFSRASLLQLGSQRLLFISGTASIVGHESLHRGDVTAQTHETLANIEALLTSAAAAGCPLRLADLELKVFVRHPQDYPAVRAVLAAHGANAARCLYVQADVCREELLVEIEAFGVRESDDET